MNELLKKLFKELKNKNLTISTSESVTCGLIAKYIGDISGISSYYKGGFVVYSNEAKINLLSVNKETIDKYGAVSKETAREMCLNTSKIMKTNISISITGNAGPNVMENKENGKSYVCISVDEKIYEKEISLNKSNSRNDNRELFAIETIEFLLKSI